MSHKKAQKSQKGVGYLKVNRVLILLVTVALVGPVFGQAKTPPSVVGAETFVSQEGRFSIALPAGIYGVKPLAIDSPAGKLTGNAYEWKMKEGQFTVGFVDAPQSIEDAETSARILGSIRERMSPWATSKNGKLTSDKQVEIDKHPGLELTFEFPKARLWQRFYVVSNRLFQVILVVNEDQRADEAMAVKVFDSFKVLSPAAEENLLLSGSGRTQFAVGETTSSLPLLSKHRLPS